MAKEEACSMKYKATAFYDNQLRHIEGGGHTEYFESDYQIRERDEFRFKDLFGFFLVDEVTIDLKDDIVFLLISPNVRYR